MIVILWAMPRSRSTAFFRMMAEYGDITVLHEPFSNRAEFGRTVVNGREVASEPDLIDAIRALGQRVTVFIKDTTDERYPMVLADERFLATDAVHTFLIRHPRDTIASYHALNPEVRCHQIGADSLHELHERVWRATGTAPVVVDADDLIADPPGIVRAWCERVGLPYRPDALRWRPADRPEWTPTARWHVTAARSTGFDATATRYAVDVERDPVLSGHLRHHRGFYEALYPQRLRPRPDPVSPAR